MFKVVMEMGAPYSDMEIASFMSCSKGYMGECGIRGGYAEIVNMDTAVMAMLQKSISARLCPTVLGQVKNESKAFGKARKLLKADPTIHVSKKVLEEGERETNQIRPRIRVSVKRVKLMQLHATKD